jgi:hypothetical protein
MYLFAYNCICPCVHAHVSPAQGYRSTEQKGHKEAGKLDRKKHRETGALVRGSTGRKEQKTDGSTKVVGTQKRGYGMPGTLVRQYY